MVMVMGRTAMFDLTSAFQLMESYSISSRLNAAKMFFLISRGVGHNLDVLGPYLSVSS